MLMETPRASGSGPGQPRRRYTGAHIRIRNLTFAYPQQRVPALQGIDLDIEPGLMGIVGRTGAGKTTLCHLLTRLYPVPDGTLSLRWA